MADDNFLQPEDDSSVPINDPSGQMPGLAGYVKKKLKIQKTADVHTNIVGYKRIRTLEEFTILQPSIVIPNVLKYL